MSNGILSLGLAKNNASAEESKGNRFVNSLHGGRYEGPIVSLENFQHRCIDLLIFRLRLGALHLRSDRANDELLGRFAL